MVQLLTVSLSAYSQVGQKSLVYTENAEAVALCPNIDPFLNATKSVWNAKVTISPLIDGDALIQPDLKTMLWMNYDWKAQSGEMLVSGARQPGDYKQVMKILRFASTSEDVSVREVRFYWCSKQNQADCNNEEYTLSFVVRISLLNTNDAPSFEFLMPKQIYAINKPGIVIASQISIRDDDSSKFTRAAVKIAREYENGADTLSLSSTPNGLTWDWNAAAGAGSLVGEGTTAMYESALRQIKFSSSSENPERPTRVVYFSVTDEEGASTLDSSSMQSDISLVSRRE
jgi:hypothetical protein